MLDAEEFNAWFRLLETPGLGRESIRRLLAAFGSPQGVLAALPSSRRDVAGTAAVQALLVEPPEYRKRLDAAWGWRQGGAARRVLTLGDPAYPANLLQTADPPLLLYAQGRLELLQAPAMAVVGSRNPSAQGRDNARAFAAFLSEHGYCVVSGLALGIDGAAHEGALSGPGSSIAVVGNGLDQTYPRRHQGLTERLATQGLLLSEYAPGVPPLPPHFPARNRIIAGLAQGTLVVEAALQSGSLITARLAAECGREVFAVPGSIHSPHARGCHALIKQGAKLVESGQDILEELQGLRAPSPEQPAPSADPLLRDMGFDPLSLDELAARTGLAVQDLGARLLELELHGAVARLPGGLFQRRHQA